MEINKVNPECASQLQQFLSVHWQRGEIKTER